MGKELKSGEVERLYNVHMKKPMMKVIGKTVDLFIICLGLMPLYLFALHCWRWHFTMSLKALLFEVPGLIVVVFKTVELFSPENLRNNYIRGVYWIALALTVTWVFIVLAPWPQP